MIRMEEGKWWYRCDTCHIGCSHPLQEEKDGRYMVRAVLFHLVLKNNTEEVETIYCDKCWKDLIC